MVDNVTNVDGLISAPTLFGLDPMESDVEGGSAISLPSQLWELVDAYCESTQIKRSTSFEIEGKNTSPRKKPRRKNWQGRKRSRGRSHVRMTTILSGSGSNLNSIRQRVSRAVTPG